MKQLVISVTDSARVDRQITMSVAEPVNLGRVAQTALDELLSNEQDAVEFPVFLDIHMAEQFTHTAWMRQAS